MAKLRCPICQRRFDEATSQALPFCGERCRKIDLGRWLGEEYSVPVVPQNEDDETAPTSDDTPDT